MMKALLQRKEYTNKQVTGNLTVRDAQGKIVFTSDTLELDWQNNAPRESCIPKGTYLCVPRTSKKYGKHLHVTNVPNRSLILIHHGNYHTDILGCILVGRGYSDLNKDGYKDILNSRVTMRELMRICPNGFELTVQ